MILLIDNYDSFSYNLYQLIGSVDPDIRVIRNDQMTLSEIEALAPRAIFLSPGPGKPADAGICEDVIQTFTGKIPLFGVCLGHQAICEALGGTVSYAERLMHGKVSEVTLDHTGRLFAGLPDTIPVARYHIGSPRFQGGCGEIMAVEHKKYPVCGVQFHPESVMTPDGQTIIRNFLEGTHHD